MRSLQEFSEAHEAQMKQFDERVDDYMLLLQAAERTGLIPKSKPAVFLQASSMLRDMLQKSHDHTVETVDAIMKKSDDASMTIKGQAGVSRESIESTVTKFRTMLEDFGDNACESMMSRSLADHQKLIDDHFSEYK